MGTPTHSGEKLTAIIAPIIQAQGLFLDDISITTRGRSTVVEVIVDLPEDAIGGVNADDLADVTRAISGALDDNDPFDGPYTLEVATPGLDRPLTLPRHFKRARTRLISLTLDDGSTVKGRVAQADENTVSLEVDGELLTFDLNQVTSARIELDFSGNSTTE